MGFKLSKEEMQNVFNHLLDDYTVYAPVLKKGEGTFSDVDVVRYDTVNSLDEIEWEKKSDYSAKEVLLSINQTIFYFTEGQTTVPEGPKKDILVFLRSCDLHAIKRLDDIYLKNGYEDFYYARVREKTKFVLMGCKNTCETGFCVSMNTNKSDDYDLYVSVQDDVCVDVKDDVLKGYFKEGKEAEVTVDYVTENNEVVNIPSKVPDDVLNLEIWKEYGDRCITCGRCNFACPTCTCFTMQDIFYNDNPRVGERRRVWASCQIDGYTNIAGGHGFRQGKNDRIRFKVMHKIFDFKKRFGYTMCVGCGRCDAICPEYISHVNLINKLAKEEE